MAKITGGLFGEIRGDVSDVTFDVVRGLEGVQQFVKPKNRPNPKNIGPMIPWIEKMKLSNDLWQAMSDGHILPVWRSGVSDGNWWAEATGVLIEMIDEDFEFTQDSTNGFSDFQKPSGINIFRISMFSNRHVLEWEEDPQSRQGINVNMQFYIFPVDWSSNDDSFAPYHLKNEGPWDPDDNPREEDNIFLELGRSYRILMFANTKSGFRREVSNIKFITFTA